MPSCFPHLKFSCVAALSASLIGCGGSSGGGESKSEVPPLATYSLSTYQTQSNELQSDNLVGTWVGVHNFYSTIGSTFDPEATASESGSALEVVIMFRDESDTLRVSNCLGGFDSITETSSELTTEHRDFIKLDNKTLTVNESRFSSMAIFANNKNTSARFVKISNSIQPLGTLKWNRIYQDGEISSPISCIYKENINGVSADQSKWTSHGVKVASVHGAMLLSTRMLDQLGFCDATKENVDCFSFGSPYMDIDGISFSVSGEDSHQLFADFSATRESDGESLVGSIEIQIPRN